jgi:hypothetical protein
VQPKREILDSTTYYSEGEEMGHKTLCDWTKEDRIKNLSDYAEIVQKPRFMCDTCGRVARKKKSLCKPHRLVPKTNNRST